MEKCPYCEKPIEKDQVICLNCGRQLKPLRTRSFLNTKWCWIFIIIMLVIMMLMLFIPSLL